MTTVTYTKQKSLLKGYMLRSDSLLYRYHRKVKNLERVIHNWQNLPWQLNVSLPVMIRKCQEYAVSCTCEDTTLLGEIYSNDVAPGSKRLVLRGSQVPATVRGTIIQRYFFLVSVQFNSRRIAGNGKLESPRNGSARCG
jgi:hypothetical protein